MQGEIDHVPDQSKQEKKAGKLLQSDKSCMQISEKKLGINSDKMGASDFCIIDKGNKIISQTNWEMKDDEYFKQLNANFKTVVD
ncbi:hypothetical protein [Bacteroides difficilis]|uniref:hypothetical protein n=1 Tax=Bacteroides difficilis TaxID=2763021 RepID=UPI003AB085C4